MPSWSSTTEQPAQYEATLDTLPVTVLRGVGPRLTAKLSALAIETVQDVLVNFVHVR